MTKYEPTIGLEIHAEIKTRTKMFCDCLNNSDEETPNVNVCPICLAHPGSLPTINKEAVKAIIKVGYALGGAILNHCKFDRKSYFYRAGLPLMELVTKPVIKSADEALRFAKELQLTLRYLGISDADMEKGQMRVEANISIRPKKLFTGKKLGTK